MEHISDADFDDYMEGMYQEHVSRQGYEDGEGMDLCQFQDPGGNSSLRAATPTNPRNLPCPTCGKPNKLTPADRAAGYQCNGCADRDEGRNC